jgi:hypothetical protein
MGVNSHAAKRAGYHKAGINPLFFSLQTAPRFSGRKNTEVFKNRPDKLPGYFTMVVRRVGFEPGPQWRHHPQLAIFLFLSLVLNTHSIYFAV